MIVTDYSIVNKAFRSERLTGQAPDDDFISVQHPYQTPVPLSEVEEWASLSEEPVVINNVEKPLFVYIKMPRANNLDPNSPLGTSVYSRATAAPAPAARPPPRGRGGERAGGRAGGPDSLGIRCYRGSNPRIS